VLIETAPLRGAVALTRKIGSRSPPQKPAVPTTQGATPPARVPEPMAVIARSAKRDEAHYTSNPETPGFSLVFLDRHGRP
jgi:hypothetical protein